MGISASEGAAQQNDAPPVHVYMHTLKRDRPLSPQRVIDKIHTQRDAPDLTELKYSLCLYCLFLPALIQP